MLDINQSLCLPKAGLNTKNESKRPPLCGGLGSVLVFNSIHWKKTTRREPVHAALVHISKTLKNRLHYKNDRTVGNFPPHQKKRRFFSYFLLKKCQIANEYLILNRSTFPLNFALLSTFSKENKKKNTYYL